MIQLKAPFTVSFWKSLCRWQKLEMCLDFAKAEEKCGKLPWRRNLRHIYILPTSLRSLNRPDALHPDLLYNERELASVAARRQLALYLVQVHRISELESRTGSLPPG